MSVEEPEYKATAPFTAIAFMIGCATSIAAGYIGMKIAVLTNSRTTFGCCENVHVGFLAAFRGGQVLGFVLVGLAVLVLHLSIITFKGGFYNPGFEELQAAAGENPVDP
jgi:Na+/H+-translocating membrane pyrophosphatase